MKSSRLFIGILAAIVILTMAACKKSNPDTQHLQVLVEQINANAGSELSNGMTLSKCEYKDGDSIFTYYVKVADKRFDNVDQKAIKDSVSGDLNNPKLQKLVKTLAANNIGLQYIFDTDSQTIPIKFTPDELKQLITTKK